MQMLSYGSGLGSASGRGEEMSGDWLLWRNRKPIISDWAALQVAFKIGPYMADQQIILALLVLRNRLLKCF